MAVALVAGCGATTSSGGNDLAPGGPASLLLVDDATLAPLTEGAPAQIIHGPQGGYHILVTLLGQNFWPGTPGLGDHPTTDLHALRADGVEITLVEDNISTLHLAWDRDPAGLLLRQKQLRLDTKAPAALGGQPLTLRAQVVDKDGRGASDQRRVIAQAPLD